MSSTTLAKQVSCQQQTMEACIQQSQKLNDDNVHKTECDRLLGKIALDVQPFTITQNGIRCLVAYLEPHYTLPSPSHISHTVIHGIYGRLKEHVGAVVNAVEYMVFPWIAFSGVLNRPLDNG